MEFLALFFVVIVSAVGCDAMASMLPVSDGKTYDLRQDVRGAFAGVHASVLIFGSLVLLVLQ